jgi:hypothetical protein
LKANEPECKLPKQVGYCRAHIIRYYFNSATNKCEQFAYGGCGGNKNRFNTLEDCEETCYAQPKSAETDDKDDDNNISNENDISIEDDRQSIVAEADCTLPALVGPCRARKLRYYFDKDSNICRGK